MRASSFIGLVAPFRGQPFRGQLTDPRSEVRDLSPERTLC